MTTAAPTEGIPRRFLQAFLLLSLERHGTSYGYELCETVRHQGVAVDLAGVYRGLRTMERHDLVTSDWVRSENGPDRRVYSLTDAGQEAATAAATELQELRDALSAVLVSLGIEADPAVPNAT